MIADKIASGIYIMGIGRLGGTIWEKSRLNRGYRPFSAYLMVRSYPAINSSLLMFLGFSSQFSSQVHTVNSL